MRRSRIGLSRKVFSRTEFDEIVRSHHFHNEAQQIGLAYRLSKYGHRGQKRMDDERYFNHCKSVALIVMIELRIFLSYLIICALLHDIMEDTFMLLWHDIEAIFGKKVYKGLRIVTKEGGKDYYRDLRDADWWIIVLKLVDRLHNLRTLGQTTSAHITKQLHGTKQNILPLFDILEQKIPQKYAQVVPYLRKEYDHAARHARLCLKRLTAN